jgi:hypothetical protein
MKGISIHDNFLSKEEQDFVMEHCLQAPYFSGITDNPGTPATGMYSPIYENGSVVNLLEVTKTFDPDRVYNLLHSKVVKDFSSSIVNMRLAEMYVNSFAPTEIPYFHVDIDDYNEGQTFLYYANQEWNMNDGGETQFLIDDEIYGVLPIPNRMVTFNAKILHRATSFRNRYRFTLAGRYCT